jgi:putative transposase
MRAYDAVMARPLRIEYAGAVYHVTSRGNARQRIFDDAWDRESFLNVLSRVVKRWKWRCHAYCLMDNHYHLLIETPDGGLSAGMRQLNGIYTQRVNRRHGRVGHLFQGRFKAILVDRESYLLELCRYVVLNPVRAGQVRSPAAYPWSSYPATAGHTAPPAWLTIEWVLSQFAGRRDVAQARYRVFVKDGMTQPAPWDRLRGQILLGERAFIERVRPLLQKRQTLREIPRTQRLAARPGLEELFKEIEGTRSARWKRARQMRMAYWTHRYTLSEIATAAGVHYTTVSKIVNKVNSSSRSDPK